MTEAALALNEKFVHGAGVVQLVVWRVPEPVPPAEHAFKYRLVYVVDGVRVVGYDNERGKGDHKHIGATETRYVFTTVATLIEDFWNDVRRAQP